MGRPRVDDYFGYGIGDHFREKEGRHVAEVNQIVSGTVYGTWLDTGWRTDGFLRSEIVKVEKERSYTMDPHSVEDWEKILSRLPCPEGTKPEEAVAQRIIGDLVGYSHNSRHRPRDAAEIANALQAFARLRDRVTS